VGRQYLNSFVERIDPDIIDFHDGRQAGVVDAVRAAPVAAEGQV